MPTKQKSTRARKTAPRRSGKAKARRSPVSLDLFPRGASYSSTFAQTIPVAADYFYPSATSQDHLTLALLGQDPRIDRDELQQLEKGLSYQMALGGGGGARASPYARRIRHHTKKK